MSDRTLSRRASRFTEERAEEPGGNKPRVRGWRGVTLGVRLQGGKLAMVTVKFRIELERGHFRC